jgi:putative ABC transport system substrate-binding protein
MTYRRNLIIALGATALVSPLANFAQPSRRVRRVGFLSSRGRPATLETDRFGAFAQGMRSLGYTEGGDLTIEWRFADGKYERLSELASDLVRLKVDAIVTDGTPATIAAQKASATIPIVMGAVADPVGSGLVKSLGRPGGNTTGITNIGDLLSSKNLGWLLGMVPTLSRVAVLVNPDNQSHIAILKYVRDDAKKSALTVLPMEARSLPEITEAFAQMVREKAGAVVILIDPYFNQQQQQIAVLAEKYRLPSIEAVRGYAEAGGLMSYGQNLSESYRRAATYVDKILKGAKPGNLPVEQSTSFELFVNGKTARALGLKIPQSILISAAQIIE